jgi:hypothetical protein
MQISMCNPLYRQGFSVARKCKKFLFGAIAFHAIAPLITKVSTDGLKYRVGVITFLNT